MRAYSRKERRAIRRFRRRYGMDPPEQTIEAEATIAPTEISGAATIYPAELDLSLVSAASYELKPPRANEETHASILAAGFYPLEVTAMGDTRRRWVRGLPLDPDGDIR